MKWPTIWWCSNEPKFISLPYIKGKSETLKSIFATYKIKCSFYSKEILSKPKDPVELDKKSNFVYKIPCKDCNVSYIGETKRSFKVRINEHKKGKMLIKMKSLTIVGKIIMTWIGKNEGLKMRSHIFMPRLLYLILFKQNFIDSGDVDSYIPNLTNKLNCFVLSKKLR